MGFQLDTVSDNIFTADGVSVGSMQGGAIVLNLSVTGQPEQLLGFLRAVAVAYEAIHPPSAFIDIDLGESDGDTVWIGPVLLEEKTVKLKGNIIRIHMNDVDGWPSNLHGHVQNRPGQKIDVYTGEIFCIENKKKIGSLGKKDLCRLHIELNKLDWASSKIKEYQKKSRHYQ